MSTEETHPADHPLTYKQKLLVQDTWEKVVPISDTAAELFYGKLFELDPELKPMFANSDMKEQGKKLMQMIGAAVKGLDSLGELVPLHRRNQGSLDHYLHHLGQSNDRGR